MAGGALVSDLLRQNLATCLSSNDGAHGRYIEAKQSSANDSDGGNEVWVSDLLHHIGGCGCPRYRGEFRCWRVLVVVVVVVRCKKRGDEAKVARR